MVTDFIVCTDQLTGIQGDINTQVKAHVEQINQFTKKFSLNEKIQAIEMQKGTCQWWAWSQNFFKKTKWKINISVLESKDGLSLSGTKEKPLFLSLDYPLWN